MVRKFVKERDKITIEGVTLPGLLILHKISRDGEQRLGDLAEQMDFTSGAITALSDKLEAKGFAVRRRLAEDRRTVMLDITGEGRAMYERNSGIGLRCITALFDGFTAEELAAQAGFYRRMIGNLGSFAETILEEAESGNERGQAAAQAEKQAETDERKRINNTNFLSY